MKLKNRTLGRRRTLALLTAALVLAALCSSASASAASRWNIAGSEFTGEATYAATGTVTFEIGDLGATFKCTGSPNGKISGGESFTEEGTYSCTLAEMPICEFWPVPLNFAGTGQSYSLTTKAVFTTKNSECSWYHITEVEVGAFTASYGPEAVRLTSSATATGSFGSHLVHASRSLTGELTGAQGSKSWGFHPTHYTYQSSFGSKGSGNGQFSHPAGSALDASGNLWVLDQGNGRVQEFSSNGTYLGQFKNAAGRSPFTSASDLTIDSSGNLWIVITEWGQVAEYNQKGEWLGKFGSEGTGYGQFKNPHGIAIDSHGNFWVTSWGVSAIPILQEFNSKGEFVKAVGSKGPNPGQVEQAYGVAVDASGNVWVTDVTINRVVEFNEAGEFVRQFGSEGSGNGQFKKPGAVEVDSSGNVWVVDTGNSRIQEFTSTGTYLRSIGSAGSGAGQFSLTNPVGISIDAAGNMWASDTNNNRIQRWFL